MTEPPSDEVSRLDAAIATIARLEAQLITGSGVRLEDVEPLLALADEEGATALAGRVLCLTARLHLMQGRNEAARRTAALAGERFAELDAVEAHRYAGFHAESFRAAGTALSKLGRVGEALQQLEEAVRIAEAGVADPVLPPPPGATISAPSALMRGSMALAIALYYVREIDSAIEAYERAIRTADTHPELYAHFLDDALLARWNLVEALHERARRRQAAGDSTGAHDDVTTAKRLIDEQAWRFSASAGADPATNRSEPARRPGPSACAAYYGAVGEQALITGEPERAYAAFEQRLAHIQRVDYPLGLACAHVNLAQAALALGRPRSALHNTALAYEVLDRDDESETRAAVLLAEATAHHALGDFETAFDVLTRHHALRAKLEALAAKQHARRLAATLGVERARADAESARRIAELLTTLGAIGQELTAQLATDEIVRILAARIGALLDSAVLDVWLLDATGEQLVPALGDAAPILLGADSAAPGGERGVHAAPDVDPRARLATAVRKRCEIVGPGVLVAPLAAADRVIGAVMVRVERPAGLGEGEISLVRSLTTYAAIALDNATAYAQLERTIVALQTAQSKLAQKTAEFERLSLTDTLTGVANRRALNERAQVEIAALRRTPGGLAVVMFDVDHFKRVNDTYGHAVGDLMLERIASLAKKFLRPSDLIARLGGEEFALLLPMVGVDEAAAIAERIRAAIAALAVSSVGGTVRVTCSFGVAAFDERFASIEETLNRADAMLYRAKQRGRNRVEIDTRIGAAQSADARAEER